MTLEVCTVACTASGPFLPPGPPITVIDNSENLMSPCQAYQLALDQTQSDVICMIHQDVTIHDPDWMSRVEALFENKKCVAVGFGGATGLGTRDLYRKPFRIQNMVRLGYAGNQDDWETHGAHFTGDRQVAVLEQFFMAIRVDWLRSRGGWPIQNLRHHLLDAFIACEAARDDREVWQCGLACLHSGGQVSTSALYRNAVWLIGGSMESDHVLPHVLMADAYRDVLPIEVTR